MSSVTADFNEPSEEFSMKEIPLAQVSLELGHVYMADLEAGEGRLHELMRAVAPWVDAVTQRFGGPKSRISTCFLVDDYFSQAQGPDKVIPGLQRAAQAAGLQLDYLARESSCARTARSDGSFLSPAESMLTLLAPEPAPDTNGSQPPSILSGWLSNGQPMPGQDGGPAMHVTPDWQRREETSRRKHSVVVDVQLWSGQAPDRLWSCAALATVWQLLRLGLLRHRGDPMLAAVKPQKAWPVSWAELPPLINLSSTDTGFAAYRTMSVLPPRFLPVEHAVRTILGQFCPENQAHEQILKRAHSEGLVLPPDIVDRVGYVFCDSDQVYVR